MNPNLLFTNYVLHRNLNKINKLTLFSKRLNKNKQFNNFDSHIKSFKINYHI
jgi:hypothetical protein